MIRRKTIIHWLIVGVACILAAAMLLILRHIVGNTASKPADTAQQQGTSTVDTGSANVSSALQRGPFYLKITTTRFGEKTYQSFEVYFTNSETNDPIFSCGRSFAADEVKSIGWSSEGYDVVVRLRNGSTITYPYDDVSSWQQ